MIHYNVWFSFKEAVADPDAELRKMRDFLGDLKARAQIHDYTLLRTMGLHGLMIENVDTFIVEIFDEIP